MSTYGIEFIAKGPDGRPRFWWYAKALVQSGTPMMTVVEAHVDALRRGHEHGGAGQDMLLGADLWGSYLYACGVLGRQPDPVVGGERLRLTTYQAAERLVAQRAAA